MKRREFGAFHLLLLSGSWLGLSQRANALLLSDITNAEASQGLKVALEKGAIAAVKGLGQPNGFLGNDKVKIHLPGHLQVAANVLRGLGQGARLDELIAAMNYAAEAAVPSARDMLAGAVKGLNVQDAKNILAGGETAVTQFLAGKTRQPLAQQFLPVVTKIALIWPKSTTRLRARLPVWA